MTTSTQWQLAREAAEQYERILVPSILGPAAKALVERVPLEHGDTVLDVGCGTGAAARCAAEKVGGSGRVIGVDVNAGMIDVARSLPPAQGAVVEWQEGSAYQLPLEDQSVDTVLCAQSLQFLADRPTALAEMVRVLKTDGCLGISLWCDLQESPYFQALIEAVSKHVGPETAVGLKAAFGLSDAEEIRALLVKAGFSDNQIAAEQIELDLPRPELFVPVHISATPMAAGFEAASSEAQALVMQDMANQLARYERGEGVRVPFTSHFALATR